MHHLYLRMIVAALRCVNPKHEPWTSSPDNHTASPQVILRSCAGRVSCVYKVWRKTLVFQKWHEVRQCIWRL